MVGAPCIKQVAGEDRCKASIGAISFVDAIGSNQYKRRDAKHLQAVAVTRLVLSLRVKLPVAERSFRLNKLAYEGE